MNDPDVTSDWPPRTPLAAGNGTQRGRKAQKRIYGDFAAAERHTAWVRRLRRIFIIVPILIILGIAVTMIFDPFRHLPANISIGRVEIEGTKVTVETPNISGVQTNGRPFAVRAEKAVQDVAKPNIVTLAGVDSDIGMADRSNAHITADNGVYDSRLDRIRLTGKVHIKNEGHYDMHMPSVDIMLKAGILKGSEPVEVLIDQGVIKADAMTIEDQGHHILFDGRVSSHFETEEAIATQSAGDQP